MPPKTHALLSASSANRWLHCPPSARLNELCEDQGIPLLGEIPYDLSIPQAMAGGMPVTAAAPDSPASRAILKVWQNIQAGLERLPEKNELIQI